MLYLQRITCLKRKWKGDTVCFFCNNTETVQHLFFHCTIAKSVWATIATSLGATNVPTSFEQSWKRREIGCLITRSFMPWALHPFVGRYGKQGIDVV
jgi:hypothetical protein